MEKSFIDFLKTFIYCENVGKVDNEVKSRIIKELNVLGK